MAIPYVKQTWTDGSGGGTPLSAARQAYIEQGVYDAHNMPCVRAKHSANQSLVTATDTAIALNSEDFDTHGMHSGVTNNSRLTFLHAGCYVIGSCIRWANGTTGQRISRLRLNSTTDIALELDTPASSNLFVQTVTAVYNVAVNEWVEIVARQDSGGALNIEFAANYSPVLWAVRIA